MLGRVTTLALTGLETRKVTVEVDIQPGLPAFHIVGLPDAAVQESRARVRAALRNSEFEFPQRRITVNLAPADLRKAGPGFDLALAAAVLVASGQVNSDSLDGHALCGELGLDGRLRAVRGAVALAFGVREYQLRGMALARQSAAEAALVPGVRLAALDSLRDLAVLCDGDGWSAFLFNGGHPRLQPADSEAAGQPDLAHVRGHHRAKRALEIAAAGGHNLLLWGPPGSGKTMLARRLPGILPPTSHEEALEVARIQSIAGRLSNGALGGVRPFRSPHHTISVAGLVGGGSLIRPGEASLAHRGVLFLDEMAEFSRPALEALRQPVEDGVVNLCRASGWVRFPARFTLVAATNPCPCGMLGDARIECRCSPAELARYRSRLSGPLVDRIDMVVNVSRQTTGKGGAVGDEEGSAAVRDRVAGARRLQAKRLEGTPATCNAEVSPELMARLCRMTDGAKHRLDEVTGRLALSERGFDRIIRVARTIADLSEDRQIGEAHIAEAVGFRGQMLGDRLAP